MSKFREANRKQLSLLPRSVEDYVNRDAGVRVFDSLLDEIDISRIEEAYSSLGRPGYHPRILVKVLCWGIVRGVRSSRELSRACEENLSFIFLASGEKPDHRTICLFRKRFRNELAELLKQTVVIGVKESLITLETVAIDGTKLRAYAGARSFKSAEALEKEAEILEALIQEAIDKGLAVDEEEDERHGDGDGGFRLPPELQDAEKRRARIKAALNKYEASGDDNANKISTTDPDARFMKSKGTLPSYNAQAAIDADSGMVVGGYVTTSGGDHGQLSRNLQEVEQQTNRNPTSVVADKGYGAFEGLQDLVERDIDGYVFLQNEPSDRFSIECFVYDELSDTFECPAGEELVEIREKPERKKRIFATDACKLCAMLKHCAPPKRMQRHLEVSDYWQTVSDFRNKMKTHAAERMRKIRASTVEPLFGTIKSARRLHQLTFRTLEMVNPMWKLELATHNMLKIIAARMA